MPLKKLRHKQTKQKKKNRQGNEMKILWVIDAECLTERAKKNEIEHENWT